MKKLVCFIKDISETIQSEAKEQEGEFLSMLLDTLRATLLGNLLRSKTVKRSNIPGRGVMSEGERKIKAGEGTIRAGQDF